MHHTLWSLDQIYRAPYLHTVIRYKVYACCKMLFKPRGIDSYASGKSTQNIFTYKYWHVCYL